MTRVLVLAAAMACGLLAAGVARADERNWAGFYIGANIGGGFGSSDARTTTATGGTGYFAASSEASINANGRQDLNVSGRMAGLQAGYNRQHGNFVYGFEADFDVANLNEGDAITQTYPCCAPTSYTLVQDMDTNWLFTARPKAGFAFDDFLFYATGGLALTTVHYNALFTDNFAAALEKAAITKTKLGWALGAGAEYALGAHWSLKADYLYASFGNVATTTTTFTSTFGPSPTNSFSHTADLKVNIARVGVNYKF